MQNRVIKPPLVLLALAVVSFFKKYYRWYYTDVDALIG